MDPRLKKVLMTLLVLSLADEGMGPQAPEAPEQDPMYQEPPEKRPQYPVGSLGYYLKQLGSTPQHRTWPDTIHGIDGGSA